MRTILAFTALGAIAACNQAAPVPEGDRAEIECLASITVVQITDTIREATSSGTDPAELQDVRAEKIAEAVEKLQAKYPGETDSAFLEHDINNRLEKIQDALNNRNPDSPATKLMNETLALGNSCTFGGE